MLSNRKFSSLVKALFARQHYTALVGMYKYYVSPLDGFIRYTFGKGRYPCTFEIKTPIGVIKPTLYSHHDMLTVNEIFCRNDYKTDNKVNTVIDIGSNIGLSALYFLTRNKNSTCFLYEPVPQNIKKLKKTLLGFENRYSLQEVAVSDHSGELRFGVEESGRYGGLNKQLGSRASHEQPKIEQEIIVNCLAINEVLEDILDQEKSIDILKIDIEGAELKTVESIKEEFLRKINLIYIESSQAPKLLSENFLITKYNGNYRATNNKNN